MSQPNYRLWNIRVDEDAYNIRAWRDAIWLYAYGELAKVQSRERQQPSVSELAAELPEFTP